MLVSNGFLGAISGHLQPRCCLRGESVEVGAVYSWLRHSEIASTADLERARFHVPCQGTLGWTRSGRQRANDRLYACELLDDHSLIMTTRVHTDLDQGVGSFVPP